MYMYKERKQNSIKNKSFEKWTLKNAFTFRKKWDKSSHN
jgi:hypothetical protein